MSSVDVPHMMQQLKRVYVERVVRNGFEDGYLYNDNMYNLSQGELKEFNDLKDIIGQTKAMAKSGEVDMNRQGFTNEEYEQLARAEKKKAKELTDEEKALLEKKKEMRKNRDTAISILRGISIRMPMILYGADIADKETVLTPWRVVNMHLGDTLGGWNFFNEGATQRLDGPRFIDKVEVTDNVFAPDSRVLEINSKSGLYPLYVAYNIYRRRLAEQPVSSMVSPDAVEQIREEHLKIWDEVLHDNFFIVCKTPMAKSITRRTLAGFRTGVKVNTRCFDDLINTITNKREQFIKRITDGQGYWKANNDRNMKFNAVVGNPPYQVMDGGNRASAMPVYQHFINGTNIPFYTRRVGM